MQTIFEVTDDDGSVSYLHIGDAPEHDDHAITAHPLPHVHDRFHQSNLKQNKAITWLESERRPAGLFPLFKWPNQAVSPMFKSAE